MASFPNPNKPDTLYPKITGSAKDVVSHIIYQQQFHPELAIATSIALTGTVKLHGMHADIVVDSNDEVRLQSRNMYNLSLRNDLQDFAYRMIPLKPEIQKLKSRIHKRFLSLNPGLSIDDSHPLIIAGEWIGPGIQKKVAISELPTKLFVIISISINNNWVPDEPYADISSEEHNIYHISKSGFFHHDLLLEDANASLESLQHLADEVERECPFGKAFGIVGRGEGIVWKPAPPLCFDAKSWIKIKGPLSKVRPVAAKKKGQGDEEYLKEFAKSVVGEMRLEQGWQYMEEMGIERNEKGVVAYLKWLVGDVEVEESSVVKERGIDWRLLRREIEGIGRKWYFSRWKEVKMKGDLSMINARISELEVK